MRFVLAVLLAILLVGFVAAAAAGRKTNGDEQLSPKKATTKGSVEEEALKPPVASSDTSPPFVFKKAAADAANTKKNLEKLLKQDGVRDSSTPVILTVEEDGAQPGHTITVKGVNFPAESAVLIDNVPCTTVFKPDDMDRKKGAEAVPEGVDTLMCRLSQSAVNLNFNNRYDSSDGRAFVVMDRQAAVLFTLPSSTGDAKGQGGSSKNASCSVPFKFAHKKGVNHDFDKQRRAGKPAIYWIEDWRQPGPDPITVLGANFKKWSKVLIDGKPCTKTVASEYRPAHELHCTIDMFDYEHEWNSDYKTSNLRTFQICPGTPTSEEIEETRQREMALERKMERYSPPFVYHKNRTINTQFAMQMSTGMPSISSVEYHDQPGKRPIVLRGANFPFNATVLVDFTPCETKASAEHPSTEILCSLSSKTIAKQFGGKFDPNGVVFVVGKFSSHSPLVRKKAEVAGQNTKPFLYVSGLNHQNNNYEADRKSGKPTIKAIIDGGDPSSYTAFPITIYGANFAEGSQVRVDGHPCTESSLVLALPDDFITCLMTRADQQEYFHTSVWDGDGRVYQVGTFGISANEDKKKEEEEKKKKKEKEEGEKKEEKKE